MLRKLSLALAVSCASNGMAWAAEAPLSNKTDLVSVYQEAVDNNADLAAARAQYGAQKEVVPQARAGLLPNLSAGADLNNTRTELDQPAMTATRSSTVYQATLSQPIFRADRWFQLQAAKSVNEQASLQLSATEQNLILQSAEAYFNVLRSQDNLASTKAEEAAFKRQLDQSNERFDVGLSDKTDVLQSQASYDTARANRIIAQRQVEDAFEALITLTNRQYNSIQGVVHTLPILPLRRRTTPRPGSTPPPSRTSICWRATMPSMPPKTPCASARPATRRPSTQSPNTGKVTTTASVSPTRAPPASATVATRSNAPSACS